jgi:hypothetical protein
MEFSLVFRRVPLLQTLLVWRWLPTPQAAGRLLAVCPVMANFRPFLHCLRLKLRGLSRERTIPTKKLPLVCEVSANFCGERVSRG